MQVKRFRPVLLLLLLFGTLCNAQQLWIKYDYATAGDAQRALTAEKDKNAYALNLKGIFLDHSGEADSAITAYGQALDKANGNNSQTMSILLNRALAYNRKGSLSQAVEDCNRVLKLNTNKNPLYEALALRIMGNAYMYKDDSKKTMQYLQNAIKLFEKNGNKQFVNETKGELANVYLAANNYQVAAELYKNYLDSAENKDSRTYASLLLNYSECLIELGKATQARTLLKEYLPKAEASPDKELAGAFYSRLGNAEKSSGNKAAALGYYKMATNLLFEANSKHLVLILSDYIQMLDNNADFPEAIALCQKFRESGNYRKSNTQARFEFERAAAGLYKKAGLQNDAYNAMATSLELCDSLRQVSNGEDMYGALAKYRTQVEQEKNKRLEQEKEDDKKFYALIWGFIAVFAIGKVFLFRSIWLKSKLNKERLKTIEAQAALMAEQQELVMQKAENQKAAMEDKQREMVSMTLKLAKYNDSLQNIINQVDDNKITSASDCKSEIAKVITEDGFWNFFDLRFTQLHPDFKARLADQFPSLSKTEVDFCCLLKLNLSNKEIGSILYISYESVISKRYRIRKKMEMREDDDLNDLLDKV